MANKKFWIGMLALAFGMAVVGCDNPTNNGGSSNNAGDSTSNSSGGGGGAGEDRPDSALIGTWIAQNVTTSLELIIRNDGTYEYSLNGITSGRGNYSVSNGSITMQRTHIHGSGLHGTVYSLSSQWYTRSQFESAIGGSSALFNPNTATYTINGNVLTKVWLGSSTQTFTRR